MSKVKLHFPHVANGSASVGYCTASIVDHYAEVDESEAAAISHWLKNDNVTATPAPMPVIGALGPDRIGKVLKEPNPFIESKDDDDDGEGDE